MLFCAASLLAILGKVAFDGIGRPDWEFLISGLSHRPEETGIWPAVLGSVLVVSLTMLISAPVGIAAAVYLEEFAPKNKLTDLIEVNINNLAAVPSVVFGLLGLALFLGFFGMPRMLLLDKQGRVVFEGDPGLKAGRGWKPEDGPTFVDAALEKLLRS